MDQMHIGYTAWHDEKADKMPMVQTIAESAATAPALPVAAAVQKPQPKPMPGVPFAEANGYVSIEAAHYSKAVDGGGVQWQTIPDLGRTLSGISAYPTTVPITQPGGNSPHLEYQVQLSTAGPVTVQAYLAPTLNFTGGEGLRYAVSFDDEAPQIVNLHTGMVADNGNRPWEKAVAENIILKTTRHTLASPGKHVLKFWRVDPAVVLEKLVVDGGGLKPSYLGPPESATGTKATATEAKNSVGRR